MRLYILICALLFHEGLTAKSLYDSNDFVEELTEESKELLSSPDKIWIVEFYAHWCGHCIRYAPFWKKIASLFQTWKDSIVIASYNCAEYDCSSYQIPGTPTMKVFRPYNGSNNNGYEISSHKRLVLHDIFDAIKEVRNKEIANPSKYPDLAPFRGYSLQELSNEADRSVLLFKELPELDWSERIVIEYSHDPNIQFKIIDSRKRELSREFNLTSRPAVVLVNWRDRKEDNIFYVDLSSYTSTFDQVSAFIKKHLFNTDDILENDLSISDSSNNPDIVYEGDLEKTIKYMLTVEVPMYSKMQEGKFAALRFFLSTLIKYLPLRIEILRTILELRNWVDERPNFNKTDYEIKLQELEEKYDPFKRTPSEWKGCKGSSPYFRGYPCGVWTLFHVLSVSSFIHGDPMLTSDVSSSTVAMAILEYVKNFFSCRHCAKNFMKKVDNIGHLPSNPSDVILWIWKIHNMANEKLRGDSTEDPEHPKIIWPSERNCPVCRSSKGSLEALGEIWSTKDLLNYVINVYKEESIDRLSGTLASNKQDNDDEEEEDKLVTDILDGNLRDKEKLIKRLRKYCSKLT